MADPTPNTAPQQPQPQTGAPPAQPRPPVTPPSQPPQQPPQGVAGAKPVAPAPLSQQANRPRITISNPPPAEDAPPEEEKAPELSAATRAEMDAGKAALERKR